MKRLLVVGTLLAAFGIPGIAFAEEVDLATYLRLLRSAQRGSIEQKIDRVTRAGYTLSPQGLRELKQAAAARDKESARPAFGGFAKSGSSMRLGSSTFYNFDDGTTGSATRLGGSTFYNFSDGTSGSASRLGSTTIYNDNRGLSGTTSRIGDFEFHSFSDGVSGTSTRIGGLKLHNFSDGKKCTTTTIGSYTSTRCR